MRMLMNVRFPHVEFNEAVKNGSVGRKLSRIIEQSGPEAVYFTEQDGMRSAILIVNVDDPAQIPSLAEPWFLAFNADVRFRIAMTFEDLGRSALDELGKKWTL